MRKISDDDIKAHVIAFLTINLIGGEKMAAARVVDIAKSAWRQREMLHLPTNHMYLYQGMEGAGEYRKVAVLDIRRMDRDRNYPPSDEVPRLVEELFIPAYRRAMSGQIVDANHAPADVAWYIGAIFRAIHPFVVGNRVLSWVIEMQLRALFDLPPTCLLRQKQEFDRLRHELLGSYLSRKKN